MGLDVSATGAEEDDEEEGSGTIDEEGAAAEPTVVAVVDVCCFGVEHQRRAHSMASRLLVLEGRPPMRLSANVPDIIYLLLRKKYIV